MRLLLTTCLFVVLATLCPGLEPQPGLIQTGVPQKWMVAKVATKTTVITRLSKRYGWSDAVLATLQSDAEEADEIWFFDNGGSARMMGRIGYVLKRDGKLVAHRISRMN